MGDRQLQNVASKEYSDSFLCCVCLDLFYKPIVLSCGHICCFWCVHKSMNPLRESYCPVCRHPYYHFPTVCQLLHFLLLKMYPVAYRERELQILEEEKKSDCFSPQINADEFTLCVDQYLDGCHRGIDEPNPNLDGKSKVTGVNQKNVLQNQHDGSSKQITVSDVLCAACKQLLFFPIVLNCGHVYCESCVNNLEDKMLRCQVCLSPHPRGFPKVCLELRNFLEEQFPEEYARRKDTVKQGQPKTKHASMNTTEASTSGGEKKVPFGSVPRLNVHVSVGCDWCGMFPIIGDRYRCKDCLEQIGFDLCGDCYRTCSKLPGRFNQQHTPEHEFVHVQSRSDHSNIYLSQHIDDGSTSVFIANDFREILDGSAFPFLPVAPEENENSASNPATSTNDEEAQDETQNSG